VGRERELARVTRALAEPSALILVEGEAGMGKSRLVREALRSSRPDAQPGREPMIAVCPPFREPLTLGPIVDAVRQRRSDVAGLGLSPLAGSLRPLLPEWAPTLPPAPEPLDDQRAVRHRLIRALTELLERLGVTVLVVEDVHWSDEATMDFLLFLASQRPQRISLLLTYRTEEVPADSLLRRLSAQAPAGAGHARVTLGGLGRQQVAQLVSSMLDDERVSPPFAALLHERTEGVPLALEESVRLLFDRSDLVWHEGEWVRRSLDEIDVPPSIRDAVTERAARLGPGAQTMLLAAAVLVDPEDEAVLTAVSGLSAARADPALGEAIRSGLIAEDDTGRIAFRHALAAKAVYDRADRSDRRAAHGRAAAALEAARPLPVARLAHHFREARDTARWCRYAEQAADLALASGDHPTAAGLLRELLTAGRLGGADVARVTRKMPMLAVTAFQGSGDVISTLRIVLEDAGVEEHTRSLIRAQLGRMLMHIGEYAVGTEELERAIPGLLADYPGEAAWAMTLLGRPIGLPRPASEHLAWLERAARVPDAAIGPAARKTLLIDRMTALLELGEESGWELAAAFEADESSPRDALHLARFSLNAGSAAMSWGRYGEARVRLTAAADIARRHRYQRVRDLAVVSLVHLDWFTGAWNGLAQRARRWAQFDAEPLIQLDTLLVGGLLGTAAGLGARAEDAVRDVVEQSARRGIVDMSVESAGALAALRFTDGDLTEALSLTEQAVRVVADQGMWLWATDVFPARVAALLAAGRPVEAENLVELFDRGLGTRPIASTRAALETCRALIVEARGAAADAAVAWGSVAVAWYALPRPHRALRAREREAACLLRAGDRSAALSQWSELAPEFAALGARNDADRVERLLQQYAEAPAGRRRAGRGRPGYGDRLSPRELEVVELLLSGLTNREIAVALSRSPRTVAAQLNSAMRKHGVTTRTALAMAFAQTRTAPSGGPGD
jgi:DNA-binding CsgD family transcriptional regulator